MNYRIMTSSFGFKSYFSEVRTYNFVEGSETGKYAWLK